MYDELRGNLMAHATHFSVHDETSLLLLKAADAIEDLDNRLNLHRQGKIGHWIPVTERLPEHEYGESQSVLTVDLFGVMRVTYFDGGNWCLPSGEALTTLQVAPITHWMPPPEPPKEERR